MDDRSRSEEGPCLHEEEGHGDADDVGPANHHGLLALNRHAWTSHTTQARERQNVLNR